MNASNFSTGMDRPARLTARLVAFWCVLVLLFSASLQATHFHQPPVHACTHGGLQLLPLGDDAGADANCPLCVNSQSVLPAGSQASLSLQFTSAGSLPLRQGRVVPTEVAFHQATRPPPVNA